MNILVTVSVDLVDDVGNLQNLPTVDKSAYAVDILRNRKEYILVQIESK